METSIILPTYNERDNLPRLVAAIAAGFRAAVILACGRMLLDLLFRR